MYVTISVLIVLFHAFYLFLGQYESTCKKQERVRQTKRERERESEGNSEWRRWFHQWRTFPIKEQKTTKIYRWDMFEIFKISNCCYRWILNNNYRQKNVAKSSSINFWYKNRIVLSINYLYDELYCLCDYYDFGYLELSGRNHLEIIYVRIYNKEVGIL